MKDLVQHISADAVRISGPDDLNELVEQAGDASVVLLGEASHGTSEFYTMRAELTKRLIERKGFRIVAVEGDWPACYEVNRYIKGYGQAAESAEQALRAFTRWPTWMWANREIAELTRWLHSFNESRAGMDKAGFYGLDVYSLWESLDEILGYLKRTGSPDLEQARRAFDCFEPYRRDEQTYGVSASFFREDSCEQEVVDLLNRMRAERHQQEEQGDEQALSAEINALVAVNAEQYYKAMVKGGPESWNIRDQHMTETLDILLRQYGGGAKAIVWEHNTHIGDARATDMAAEGMVNVGQLAREAYGMDDVFAIGFGTYEGTVIAGKQWGSPMERVTVPAALKGSWEEAMHNAGAFDKWLMLRGRDDVYGTVIPHRAIGVVYDPRYERYGNYVPSVMSERYDAFIHVERSKALEPLAGIPVEAY
ncbi:erythromycin esterase family protein [Paenibacillus tarimensis]|uniref:erythromycin esterase family protein n=1 Tax=Paenibacillus tarimensis TaxID=416012 RepID=UPI001F175ADD|nr:erythromycin esterase family protein [Paenibacillus tarimensis]MCF2945096.1 erythromycin esterase family protein [Paenibacillus tarimensis]